MVLFCVEPQMLLNSRFLRFFTRWIHFPCTSATDKTLLHENIFLGGINLTQGCWVRASKATSVLCSPL